MSVLESLKRIAAEQLSAYPQYRGHFDDYVLVRVKRAVVTKLGVAFSPMEVAIAKPEADGEFRTVYSIRNKIDTSVRARNVVDIH